MMIINQLFRLKDIPKIMDLLLECLMEDSCAKLREKTVLKLKGHEDELHTFVKDDQNIVKNLTKFRKITIL